MTWLLVTRCPLMAQLWRFWASFPGIHIAQFPAQVIGNCGVISLMQCSNRGKGKSLREGDGIRRRIAATLDRLPRPAWPLGRLRSDIHNCRLAVRTI